ncbi:MAG: NAD(P)-dependent oxidoreductase [Candidatus Omnitrophota bacterium]|jgi:3-hydroxyisobutyrate dehydrogenase-like beta-hydroxyacid dehydrogenase|nr:MAG: NAD(P)-dependent oxidoreductase [Candidatus Omnitrophota bacterium]
MIPNKNQEGAIMKRIGFVGLGTMGAYMARNLMKAGFELYVYNRTAERLASIVQEGATACSSPAEVGEKSELVVICVSDAPDVRQIVMGEKGIESGMAPGDIIVDCSTSSAGLAREMYEFLKKNGIGILDAPVSGGPEGAKNGTLAIMVGGDEEIVERAMPVLQAMGKTITHVGPAGAGQITKAINQIICAITLEAVAEGIALAKKSGVDAEKVLHAISDGAAKSWILSMRGPLMLHEAFLPANFSLALQAKDIRLALEAAADRNTDLPLTKKIHEILQSLVEKGLGRLDHSCVYQHVKELNEL